MLQRGLAAHRIDLAHCRGQPVAATVLHRLAPHAATHLLAGLLAAANPDPPRLAVSPRGKSGSAPGLSPQRPL